jgi:lipoyl-dependent peroxiredoxin
MAARTATAHWSGGLNDGDGSLALGSGAFEGKYSYKTRFEDEPGTNPEELLGAAHAGCFTMALSVVLGQSDHVADSLDTTAKVHLRGGEGGPHIPKIELAVTGRVPGMDQEAFAKAAETAKRNCVISKALSVEDITVEATLES